MIYKQNGRWYYRFQIRGRRIHRAIPEARTKWQAEQAEIRARDEAFQQKYGWEPSSVVFEEFTKNEYLPLSKQEKRSWRNDYSRSKPLLAAFGKRPMRNIGEMAVRQYRKERLATITERKRPRAPASVDREIQLLSRIYGLAIERGLLRENPCKGIKLSKPSRIVRYLSQDEEARLLRVLNKPRRTHLRDILLIDLYTGMRKSEVLSLHKNQVDFLRGRIILTVTKNGKPRAVPIHPDILSTLQALCQTTETGYLFENTRTKKPIKDIKTCWKNALKDAGIDHLPFHCGGRHTFGTRAAAGGANLADIQAVMDHADIRTTMQYVHATGEGQRRAIDAAARETNGRDADKTKRATG